MQEEERKIFAKNLRFRRAITNSQVADRHIEPASMHIADLVVNILSFNFNFSLFSYLEMLQIFLSKTE